MSFFPFDNSYARLPERFFTRTEPTPVAEPKLIRLNQPLADELGITLGDDAAAIFAGNRLPAGAEPIAQAYAGHQFGSFVPQLGDGRAILLGEIIDKHGNRRDIQLKGSGVTPFSRRGDGRAALGPVLREYLMGEAMAGLGIPTSRALAAVTTGEPVFRETVLPGAVLTRVAASHIRIGTFQFFAARRDNEAIKILTDYAIARHHPGAETPLAFFEGVMKAQASLIAQWLSVGFIHGVMNTDNMTISGETIDYGPCAFLDAYQPDKTFSSIDDYGRYAFAQQPRIAQWNLARLAECLLPLLAEEPEAAVKIAEDALDLFPDLFAEAFTDSMRRKLGLKLEMSGDLALAQDLLSEMAAKQADFTLTFRQLSRGTLIGFEDWRARWTQRLAEENSTPEACRQAMLAANPQVIARNHLVEGAIAAATQQGDLGPFETLLADLANPFADNPRHDQPPPVLEGYRTFCGT